MPTGRTIEVKINERRDIDETELQAAITADVQDCFGVTVDRYDNPLTGEMRVERVLIHVHGSTDPEILKTHLRRHLAQHQPTPRRTVNEILDAAAPAEKQELLEQIVRRRFGTEIIKDGEFKK